MATELSTTMQQAVAYAQKHGGVLERFPGGYWCERDRTQWDAQHAAHTVSTSTVQALVARGVADYTEWKDGRNGRFPVRMTLRVAGVPGTLKPWEIPGPNQPNPPLPRDLDPTVKRSEGNSTDGVTGTPDQTFSHQTPIPGKEEQK